MTHEAYSIIQSHLQALCLTYTDISSHSHVKMPRKWDTHKQTLIKKMCQANIVLNKLVPVQFAIVLIMHIDSLSYGHVFMHKKYCMCVTFLFKHTRKTLHTCDCEPLSHRSFLISAFIFIQWRQRFRTMKGIRSKSTASRAATLEEPTESSEESKRYRMKSNDHDAFVKLCVENFHVINDTRTVRGTPNSSKTREKVIEEAWQKIAKTMDHTTKVINQNNGFISISIKIIHTISRYEYHSELLRIIFGKCEHKSMVNICNEYLNIREKRSHYFRIVLRTSLSIVRKQKMMSFTFKNSSEI